MKLASFISKRYFFAKKSYTAINIISLISMSGVAVGTMALVVVLSVFNGFDSLIQSLFNTFDPDLKVQTIEGKSFTLDSAYIVKIGQIPGVAQVASVVEDNVILQYHQKQYTAIIKGVSDNYISVSGIDSMITEGKFRLQNGVVPFAIMGSGLAYYLGVSIDLSDPLVIYFPHRNAEITMNPEQALNKKYIVPVGIFSIESDYDSKYFIVPLNYARKVLDYTNEISALEIKLKPNAHADKVQHAVGKALGSKFSVKNRYQQQELFYKIMKSEKWAILFILSFILMVASFNIISSLTMLIIDKKKDIAVLNKLGANWKTIRKIFILDGMLISLTGAAIGIILGLLVCFIQIKFGLVKLQGSGSFVIENYPVKVVFTDLLLIFGIVSLIGFVTSYIPIRVISDKYINE